MKEAFENGINTYKLIFDRSDYTKNEEIVHWVLLPIVLFVHSVLFILISLLYLIERLFAFVFIYFITLQSKVFQKRAVCEQAFKKLYTLLSVLLFIVFLPFIAVYYIAMLLKYFLKQLMKKLLLVWDFADHIDPLTFQVFDDANMEKKFRMHGMMKDLSNNEAIGSAIEQMINESNEEPKS